MKNSFDKKTGFIMFLCILFLGSGAIYNNHQKINQSDHQSALKSMNLVLEKQAELGNIPKDVFAVNDWLEEENYSFSYSSYPIYGWSQETNKIVSYLDSPTSIALFAKKISQSSDLDSTLQWINEKKIAYAKLDIMQDQMSTISIHTKNHIVLDFHQHRVMNSSHGLDLSGSGTIEIHNAQIKLNDSSSAGIAIFEQPKVKIQNCKIETSCYGITESPSSQFAHVTIDNCTIQSPYPLYLCANNHYQINQSVFYGESVFTSGTFQINQCQFLSETTLAESLDSAFVYEQYLSFKKNQCESYGDSILIVNHRDQNHVLHSFEIHDSTIYIPLRNQISLGYGIRYIDMEPINESFVFSTILKMKNTIFSTLFGNQQRSLLSVDVFSTKK